MTGIAFVDYSGERVWFASASATSEHIWKKDLRNIYFKDIPPSVIFCCVCIEEADGAKRWLLLPPAESPSGSSSHKAFEALDSLLRHRYEDKRTAAHTSAGELMGRALWWLLRSIMRLYPTRRSHPTINIESSNSLSPAVPFYSYRLVLRPTFLAFLLSSSSWHHPAPCRRHRPRYNGGQRDPERPSVREQPLRPR